MTDKEKEAYNFFKKCNEKDLENFNYFSEPSKLQIKYIETVLNLIQTQQEEIERLKKTELKTKGGGVKVTLEGLICLETKILDLEKELNKKDTLINTMQAEFERLENLEDNTDMLKEELKKKDKIIDEAISWIKSLHDSLIEEYGDYETEFSIKGDNVEENEIKEYIISEVEKEN